MNVENNKMKKLSLCHEVELAIYYIRKGIGEINRISLSNDFYHLPILCLTAGIERLMKCILITDSYISHKIFPPNKTKYLKGSLGHDLNRLLEEMIIIGKNSKSLMSREATRNDIDYMENNEEFRQLVLILTEFATFGRYHNLDSLFKNSSDPIQDFMNFEYKIAAKNNIDIGVEKDPYKRINKIIILIIEKFTRGLCRFFTLGDFKDVGKLLSISTYDFLFLRDDQLGECNYLKEN
jgi:hypothetical protein